MGTIAGAVWAFVVGFAAGIMIAWLYNRFLLRRAVQLHPAQPLAQAPVPPHSHEPQQGTDAERKPE